MLARLNTEPNILEWVASEIIVTAAYQSCSESRTRYTTTNNFQSGADNFEKFLMEARDLSSIASSPSPS